MSDYELIMIILTFLTLLIAVDKKSFTIRCGNGALRIYNLQLEGKKRMDTSAFLLGYKVENGMQLGGR